MSSASSIRPPTYIQKSNYNQLPKCSLHNLKDCETYCIDCKQPVCIRCMIKEHKGHHVEMYEEYLSKLTSTKEHAIYSIKEVK